MFANASPERPALYVTVVGEPPLKMLRYQQQYTFFDDTKIGRGVRFLHLGDDMVDGGPEKVLARIISEVEKTSPSLVFVDSFRAVAGAAAGVDLQSFVQRLSVRLTTWQATTFLIGEYLEHEFENNPVFTMADGILWLRQTVERNSIVRRAQVIKMRGSRQIPGLHTFRITDGGLRVYPRLVNSIASQPGPRERKPTGIPGLDEMMGGGVPAGFSFMVAGPSGSGKSLLSTQFILEGIKHGEPGVIAVFEKRPEEYLQTLPAGKMLTELIAAGSVRMMYLRPLDLSVEETMESIRQQILEIGAKRLAIDSLAGFELALAPGYREDFRESLYRMLGALTNLDVTVVLTAELVESFAELRLSAHGISFLTDAIVLQRYVEVKGELARAMAVIKLRGCAHSHELRTYDIDEDGITMGGALGQYGQVFTGVPLLGGGRTRGAVGARPKRRKPSEKPRRSV